MPRRSQNTGQVLLPEVPATEAAGLPGPFFVGDCRRAISLGGITIEVQRQAIDYLATALERLQALESDMCRERSDLMLHAANEIAMEAARGMPSDLVAYCKGMGWDVPRVVDRAISDAASISGIGVKQPRLQQLAARRLWEIHQPLQEMFETNPWGGGASAAR